MTDKVNKEAAMKWLQCRPLIEAALEYCHGSHSIEDIEDGITIGRYLLWTGDKSAAITEICDFPQLRVFHIFLAGGDLEEIKQMVPHWRSFAEFNGCARLTIFGRRGWERALKEQGWNAETICLSLPATPETLQ